MKNSNKQDIPLFVSEESLQVHAKLLRESDPWYRLFGKYKDIKESNENCLDEDCPECFEEKCICLPPGV